MVSPLPVLLEASEKQSIGGLLNELLSAGERGRFLMQAISSIGEEICIIVLFLQKLKNDTAPFARYR